MICPNCGRELQDDTKFCGGCGTRMMPPAEQPAVPVTEVAPEEIQQIPELSLEQLEPQPETQTKQKPQLLAKLKGMMKKVPGKVWKFGAIGAAVLVVAIVLLCVFSGGSQAGSGVGHPDGALYLKDGELYFSDYSKKGPFEITGKLLSGASGSELARYASDISYTIHVTEDGNTMFYMDKLSNDTGTLYYRSLTNMSKEPVKIAGGVERYTVSKDGKVVTFLKGGTLYQYNMKEETKLQKNVVSYRVSDDGKIIYFKNENDTWYSLKNGEDEKIGTDITIHHYSEDYSTVYYMNGDKLYKKTIGKDKEKLLSGVELLSGIADDGTFYYMERQEYDLADFFQMDTDEYGDVKDMLDGEYLEFYDIGYYNGKEGAIIGEYCSAGSKSNKVVYFAQFDLNAVNSIPVSELVTYYYDSNCYYIADAAMAMVREQLEASKTTVVALDGKTSVLDLEDVNHIVVNSDNTELYVLCGESGSYEVEVPVEEGAVQKNQIDLYKVALSGGKIKTVDLCDEDIYWENCGYYGKGTYFVYFKDVKDDHGDLYANGMLVDSDVSVDEYIRYNSQNKSLLYMVDYNQDAYSGVLKSWDGKNVVEICEDAMGCQVLENGSVVVYYDWNSKNYERSIAVWNGKTLTEITDEGFDVTELKNGDLLVSTDYDYKKVNATLNLWNGKTLTEISEDVYDFEILPNGDVLYLYDYNTNKYEGELYHWNGKKAVLVDEDVVAIITLSSSRTHYFD